MAFVTPSYRGDFDRCRLLCESTTRFLPSGSEHLLLIDRRDLDRFRSLENDTVRLVEAESLTPRWMFRVPGINGWWASLASPPVRNWIYQQLLKLRVTTATDADIINFLDSDVTLTKPIPDGYIERDGRVRLQRVAYCDNDQARWLRVAAGLLGTPPLTDPAHSYVGNLITWTRPNVEAMAERIRASTGRSLERAVAGKLHFSEYMTYGAFVDQVVGLENSGHFHDDRPNFHLSFGRDLTDEREMDRFFDELPDDHFGVMIHSKDGVPVASYEHRVRALWDTAPGDSGRTV